MDDRNATHRHLSTTLRHAKKSVTATDVKLWQQPALGKREEAAAQENPEDLKLPVSPSREFVSTALVSSREQMIVCRDRGFSFTRAGLAVDELHLCGDPAAVSIVDQILATTGDTFEVKQYERLSPLVLQTRALGSYSHVRKGDCVVAFSRRDIYSIKKEIESSCKHNCSVVYGSLPPETRTKQVTSVLDHLKLQANNLPVKAHGPTKCRIAVTQRSQLVYHADGYTTFELLFLTNCNFITSEQY